MKKIFYICLITFFVSGVGLFYLVDKNFEAIKTKVNNRFQNSVENGDIVIGDSSELQTIEKEFSGNYKKLDITLNVGDLKVVAYDGKTIKVKGLIPQKSIKSYEVIEADGVLQIKATVAHEILVQIPKEILLEGKIKQGVGDCSIENLKNADIVLNTGDFKGKNLVDVDNVKVDLGDLELTGVKNINKIRLGTGSGKVEVLEQNRDFSIENNLGDMELSITNKFEGTIDNSVKLGDLNAQNLNTKGGQLKGNVNVDLGELTIRGIE